MLINKIDKFNFNKIKFINMSRKKNCNKKYDDSDDDEQIKENYNENNENNKKNKKDKKNKKNKKNKNDKNDKKVVIEEPLENKKTLDELYVEYEPNINLAIDNIIINNLTLRVSNKTLLENTSLRLTNESRYGLIGHNGSGKSSLLKAIFNKLFPIHPNLKITSINQTFISSVDSVFLTVLKMNHELYQLKIILDETYNDPESTNNLEELENKWLDLDGDNQEMIIYKILKGLGFNTNISDMPTNSLSGGWQRRVELAKMLYLKPDILLLDEPTNHLDLEGVLWLMDYLEDYPKIILVVSHSIDFLNTVCNNTIFLENNKLRQFKGNYYSAKISRDNEENKLKLEHEKLKKKINEMKKKSKTNKEKEEVIKKANLSILVPQHIIKFPNYSTSKIKSTLIKLEDITFSYDKDNKIFENINLEIKQDSRLTLVGRNGAGKSTLLKLIAEKLEPTSGFITSHGGLKVGYYYQHFDTLLPPDETPVSYLEKLIPPEMDSHKNPVATIRQLLGQIKLEGKSHINKIEHLSGGEKARVSWLAMIFKQPHIILLDEPTNHLDLDTVEAMIETLKTFNGCIITVTHDPSLITNLESKLIIVKDKKIEFFAGTLEDYQTFLDLN